MSFSALVLIGNGNGSAGLGYGKALKVQDAVSLFWMFFVLFVENMFFQVRAANIDGEKNIVHIKRFEGTRNVATVVVKEKGCIVWKNALTGGAGVKGET